jgi:hypothetical protein
MINENNYGLTEEDIAYLIEDPRIAYDANPSYNETDAALNSRRNANILGVKGALNVCIAFAGNGDPVVELYISHKNESIFHMESDNKTLVQICGNIKRKMRDNERSEKFNSLMNALK